uniref:TetR/AcrR family transcriptional regulator n=1 Tax=Pararhizobium sp. IMCC3301 TaxID=3067904 RepID=UPI0027404163|nr:TetR/AcrR family transcriptional regulator [Pararhizobium sp. IMCC3301]
MTNSSETKNKNHVRSARTREKVLEATIACIYEQGLQNTSTVDITKRAGISRGAMLHHYPSKQELLYAAYETLLTREAEKLRVAAADYSNGKITVDSFIDQLWGRFSIESFSITLDYFSAARTDDNLKTKVQQARKHYDDALGEIWHQFFSDSGLSEAELSNLLKLTISLFRGMGLQLLIWSDRDSMNEVVAEWKIHIKARLATPQRLVEKGDSDGLLEGTAEHSA